MLITLPSGMTTSTIPATGAPCSSTVSPEITTSTGSPPSSERMLTRSPGLKLTMPSISTEARSAISLLIFPAAIRFSSAGSTSFSMLAIKLGAVLSALPLASTTTSISDELPRSTSPLSRRASLPLVTHICLPSVRRTSITVPVSALVRLSIIASFLRTSSEISSRTRSITPSYAALAFR